MVQNFGTHYYTKADMGGKLTQISSMQDNYFFSQSSTETSNSMEMSFGASVSGYGNAASASVSYATTQTDDTSQQSEHESKTTKSSIITKGGAPGAFGPAEDNNAAPSTWSDWARSVDQLPVPINYQLALIYHVLPQANNSYGVPIPDCWLAGLLTYVLTAAQSLNVQVNYTITIFTGNTSLALCSFGPFTIRLYGSRSVVADYVAFDDSSADSDQAISSSRPITFLPNSVVSLVLRYPYVGTISNISIGPLTAAFPTFNGVDPSYNVSNWPVQTIQVLDQMSGVQYEFQNVSTVLSRCSTPLATSMCPLLRLATKLCLALKILPEPMFPCRLWSLCGA